MELSHHIIPIGCAISVCCSFNLLAVEPPTPTPRPGTLAALAGSTSLESGPRIDGDATIVITNDNLDQLGDGAILTVMDATIAETGGFETTKTDPKKREKWRRKVLAQRSALAKLEARRQHAEAELDNLERGSLNGRALDRIAKVEAKLRAINEEIKLAEVQLSRVVRAARQEGAQPGWFR